MRSGLLLATVGGLALLSLGCGDETSDAVERWDKACQAYCDAEEECKDPGWARCRSECSQDRRKIESQSVECIDADTTWMRCVNNSIYCPSDVDTCDSAADRAYNACGF